MINPSIKGSTMNPYHKGKSDEGTSLKDAITSRIEGSNVEAALLYRRSDAEVAPLKEKRGGEATER